MPIKKFEIRNEGPIKLAKIEDVPSIVIIAGPNGVGKSTLLETLKKRRGPNVRIEYTGKIIYISPHRVPAEFQLPESLPVIGPKRRYIDVLALDTFSPPAPPVVFSATGAELPRFMMYENPRTRTAPDFAPYAEMKCRLVRFEHERMRTITEVVDRYGTEIPEGIIPKDIYKPFRELVRSLLPGLEFDKIALEGDFYKINFKNRAGAIVEFDQLSSGEKDIIAMLFPFVEKEIENELARARGEEIPHEDIIVLIDTPEAYLHPTLQRNLLDYIRKSVKEAESRGEKLQFFIATHSTTIVNEATTEELYVMLFPDQSSNENQIVKVTTDEDKLRLIRDLLGDIGYLASGKPILLLEGKGDVEILGLLVPDVKEEFSVLPFGGKGKILGFIETFEKVIPELVSRGFKIFAIVDKDKEPVLDRVPDRVRDFCFVLPRRCIENFLLDSEAIYEALKVLKGEVTLQNEGIKSQRDIENLIDDIIKAPETTEEEIKNRIKTQLKFYVGEEWRDLDELEKIVHRIVDKKLGRIREQYKRLKDEVSHIVSDKEKALRELNGKIILGKIASRFGEKRDKLAREIADKLRMLNKVPQEIIDLIREIKEQL